MLKKIIFVLSLLMFVRISAQETNRFIDVAGTAELNVKADQVEITIDIRTINETLSESKKSYEETLGAVLNVLDKFKSSRQDIEVSPLSFGINYKYEKNERKEDGYYTSGRVNFKLTKIDSYYNLTDQLTHISSISISRSVYNNSEYEKHNKTAYENAVKTAIQKAEYMTAAAGLKLGKVIEILDNPASFGLMQNSPNPFNTASNLNSVSDQVSGSIQIIRSVRLKCELTE